MVEKEIEKKMQAAIEHFKQELKNLRSNRAHPGMVEGVMVEVYGAQMRLKELASITIPEARQILITPFDPSTTKAIVKGIESANLGVNPIAEAQHIRVPIPPMNQDTRNEIVKQGKKKAEEAKVVIREIRRKGNETLKQQKSSAEISEDLLKKGEKKIQELTDSFCRQVDDLFAAKEKEIMAV